MTSRSTPTITPITIPAISPSDNPSSSSACIVGEGGNANTTLMTVNPLVE